MTDSIAINNKAPSGVRDSMTLSMSTGLILNYDSTVAGVLGYLEGDLDSVQLLTLVHPEDQSLFTIFFDDCRTNTTSAQVRVRILSAQSEYIPVDLHVISTSDEGIEATVLIDLLASQSDHASVFDHDPQLNFRIDEATGLYGIDYLEFEYDRARPFLGDSLAGLALMVVELDRFNVIESALGNIGASAVVAHVAHRMDDAIGSLFPVVRLGSNQFAILCLGVTDDKHADVVARTLRSVLDTPVVAPDGEEVIITTCIGIAFANNPLLNATEVIANATMAKDRAKERGSGKVDYFQENFATNVKDRRTFENIVRRAIDAEELVVLFQPIISLTTGRIAGVEALVRLQHPERGLIPPIEFIPIAKEIGRLPRLGHQVATNAVGALADWQIRYPNMNLSLGINLSGDELEDENVVVALLEQISEFKVSVKNIMVELGNVDLGDNGPSHNSILQLIDAGVPLSVDEFGAGTSALGLFSKYPVSQVKLDRSLVLGIEKDSRSFGVLGGLVKLAHSLDAEVVGIGVERAEQIRLMRLLEIDKVQGYHIGIPMERSQIETQLELITSAEPV